MRREAIWAVVAVGVLLLVLVGTVGVVGYKQGWIAPPPLTVEFTATWPDGSPLEHVTVHALGEAHGETDAEGRVEFQIQHDVGAEVDLSASLDREGMVFEPWEGSFIVRKWERSDPDSLHYEMEGALEPKAISSKIEVVIDAAPVAGAVVKAGGKKLGKTDAEGHVGFDLGTRTSRKVQLTVSASGFKTWKQKTTLEGGETYVVSLAKIGAIDGKLMAGYESLGRIVPVPDAEASMAGRALGKTDASGYLRMSIPKAKRTVQLRRDGFMPDPAEKSVKRTSRRQLVPIFPQDAPNYRLVVLPPQNGSRGDRELESVLPEIEDKLQDYVFSYGCFERGDTEAFMRAMRKSGKSLEQIRESGWHETRMAQLADAVVYSEASLSDELVLAVRVVSATGRQLGTFAETERVSKLRKATERVAAKVVEIFPFEGYVTTLDAGSFHANLGSNGDRGVRRGQKVDILRWSGSVPPKLKRVGNGKILRVKGDGSEIEALSGKGNVEWGDKIVLLPRAKEAAFSASLELTLMAGSEGGELPFGDVSVYRDGTWIGTTSGEGRIKIPVASRSTHSLLFVRNGIKPYSEEVETGKGNQKKTVLVPQTMSRLRIDSEPSGAVVVIDDRELGTTPLEATVLMGFRRVRIDGPEGYRAFDQVLEFKSLERDYTGSRRIVLEVDVLTKADGLASSGDIDGAIELLAGVESDHPDYSAARNYLGGLYLDEKNEIDRAIEEFELVLSRPENRQLVDKRFAVTFLNLGRAYYLRGKSDDYELAISNLKIARNNKRFFPPDRHETASHSTLYFLALASHKLYHEDPNDLLLGDTSRRWKDYFDFFPASLREDAEVTSTREGAQQYYDEILAKLER